MKGELSRFDRNEPALPHDPSTPGELEARSTPTPEGKEDEATVKELIQKTLELYQAAGKLDRYEAFPRDTGDLIQKLCVAQDALLQERLHNIHPEDYPAETVSGDKYSHRTLVKVTLEGALRILSRSDSRTIDAKADAEGQ